MQYKQKTKDAFLDGTETHLADQNARSQNTNMTWLNANTHGLRQQKKQGHIREFLSNLD